MDDLIAFLQARLDDDAEVVRHARDISDVARRGGYAMVMAASDAAFVVHFNRNRELAEIEAKRGQIAHYGRVASRAEQHPDYELAVGACKVALRHMSLAYADHPDYRQEWTP